MTSTDAPSTDVTASAAVVAPATTVADVLRQLTDIVAGLPDNDGVSRFAAMYLAVTLAVKASVGGHVFGDAAWIADLDVSFANLFFSAYTADAARQPVPPAWRPLFEARHRSDITGAQFAVAGMNAHINRDLALAVVTTCERTGVTPTYGSAQHADYETVNTVLAEVEPQVRRNLIGELAPELADRVADRLAVWDIGAARDAAWVAAEARWELRHLPPLQQRLLDATDHTVGLVSRALLLPVT